MKRENGITLIALIITIIILVILAAVSIRAAYNSGIIDYSINGTKKYQEEANKEESILSETEDVIASLLSRIDEIDSEESEEDYVSKDWVVAWAVLEDENGKYWSNPYFKDESLLDEYFPEKNDAYSINSIEDLQNDGVKALLFENDGEENTFTMVICGNGECPEEDEFGIKMNYVCGNDRRFKERYSSSFYSDFGSKVSRLEIKEGITSLR